MFILLGRKEAENGQDREAARACHEISPGGLKAGLRGALDLILLAWSVRVGSGLGKKEPGPSCSFWKLLDLID